jgi:hypothetical protein
VRELPEGSRFSNIRASDVINQHTDAEIASIKAEAEEKDSNAWPLVSYGQKRQMMPD